MKKLIAVLSAAVIAAGILAGCSQANEAEQAQGGADSETTVSTTTTTMRTTEDLETTFKEAQTNKIYDALTKDSDGSYPYEIATYTTYYDSSNATRTTNLHNATDRLNNLKIPAGKTFSFNQTVGKRTVTSGYEEAKIVNGKEFVDGLGGGICQVSSTIFQAALRANMDITVRACHSLEISYVPLGGDATVQWNTQDFQFKNSSDCDIRLSVTANNGALTCTIYAKEDITPKNLDVKITKEDKSYKLTRTVDGEVNYTAYSKYSKPVTTTESTTDKDKKKEKETEKKKTTTEKQ